MATAFEEKLRTLQELGVDTPEGILQLLTGIGARGLDTPTEREFLYNTISQGTALTDEQKQMIGVMDVGKIENPLYGSNYYEGTMMQDTGFHPKYLERDNEYQMDVSKALADTDITKLGIGARGLNTPAEREFLMKQRAFEAELMKLSSADLSNVLERLQAMTPVEKDTYMNHVLENGFSYGHINESAPLRTQGFQQYNTGTAIPNLGFTGYSQGY
jgi:hypothetical protein